MISAGKSRQGGPERGAVLERSTTARALHCDACGAPAPVQTRLGWLCSDCGYELCEGRCGSCGKKLERCGCGAPDEL